MKDKNTFACLNRKSKWLGIIDYKSLVVLIIYVFAVWSVFGIFIQNIIYRMYFTVIFLIPVLGLFYSHKDTEDITDVICAVIKFVFSPKLYVQKLENENNFENCCKL